MEIPGNFWTLQVLTGYDKWSKNQYRIWSLGPTHGHYSDYMYTLCMQAAAAQRKLRQFGSSRPTSHSEKEWAALPSDQTPGYSLFISVPSPRLEAQKAWLDEEVEKVLQWKGAVEALEKVCGQSQCVHCAPMMYCRLYADICIGLGLFRASLSREENVYMCLFVSQTDTLLSASNCI